MAKHRRMPDDEPQPAAGESGATYWSVTEGDWPDVRPSLPTEMVDLLAPPIVVGVARVVATSRMTPPVDPDSPARPPLPARAATAGGRPPQSGTTTVRLTTAASTRPPTPARRPAGRHRTA